MQLYRRECGCAWQVFMGEDGVVFTARCARHALMCRSLEPWEYVLTGERVDDQQERASAVDNVGLPGDNGGPGQDVGAEHVLTPEKEKTGGEAP